MKKVCLMLGSNLGDRIYLIGKAIELIKLELSPNLKASSVYFTEPWGTKIPLPYLNIAVSFETSVSAHSVLKKILSIEKKLGRIRDGNQNAPRTIDIDIILYDDLVLKSKNLTIPHPRMHLRRFVLVPLSEIEPDLIHPEFGISIKKLLERCTDELTVNIFEA